MTKVSVIIVNYNVRYFIEQAIVSIKKASKNISCEIIVVDNASSDNSIEMLEQKFPEITLVANTENVGFGRANNQGIQLAKGETILLLNPDTVLQEDTLELCLEFMKNHLDCGALGVKMIDGKGNFLPESKRALPTPLVAFYKMIGLSSLLPKSKTFGKYHLGYLDKNENHEVEVLSGAFMFFRGDLLKKIGGFDEDYFMYGEDIDLSYQVLKQGYKNYYLADTSIIHYKGESTKKGSLNYVKVFYEAMLIFANKHFSPAQAKIYSIAIYFAIFLKGSLTLLSNFFRKTSLAILDITSSFFGIFLLTNLWEVQIKSDPNYYPFSFFAYVLPFYVLVWFLSNLIIGSYEKPYQSKKVWRSIFFGTLVIAAIYGFLPENLRFSRAIILLGAVFTACAMLFNRFLYHFIVYKKAKVELNEKAKVAIVGNGKEAQRALDLLKDSLQNFEFTGFINFEKEENKESFLGEYKNIEDIVDLYGIEELIFCGKDVPSLKIISAMSILGNSFNYKILPEESISIIGSNSKNSAGDLYAIDVNLKIASSRAKWTKRFFDISLSFLLLVFFPICIFFVKKKTSFLSNILHVLIGKLSWVGYHPILEKEENYKLPKIKKGILSPLQKMKSKKGLTGNRLNLLYAKNYSLKTDCSIIFNGFSSLGNLTKV